MNVKNNKLLMFGLIFLLLISISVASTFIADTGLSQFFSSFNMNNNNISNVSNINGINYSQFYSNYSLTRTALTSTNTTANSALSLATTANTTANTANSTANALVTSNTTTDLRIDGNTYWNAKVPAEGLVSYYSFEGNAKDSIGGNDGTVTGATQTTSGIVGSAYSFNGSGAYINSNVVDNSASYTLSAWVKSNSLASSTVKGVVGVRDTTGNNRLYIAQNVGTTTFTFSDTCTYYVHIKN
jgi:hypothetical protein